MNITAAQFAKESKVSRSYLSELLNGKKENPSNSVLKRFLSTGTKHGFDFTVEDWMFNPEKIKHALNKETA